MSILERLAREQESTGAVGRHSILLGSIVILLALLPLFQSFPGSGIRFSALLTIVLIAAVYVSSTERWLFVSALVMGVGAILSNVIATTTGSHSALIAFDCLSLGLLAFTTLLLLNSLAHTREVSRDTVVGGVCVYFLIGLCFTVGYILVSDLYPGCLQEHGVALVRPGMEGDQSGFAETILYFSFVTLTTLGYGDIVPMTAIARMMVSIEAVIGQLFIAIFIARLVARSRG